MAIFRVTVRGWFDHLTDDQRARLVAELEAHDVVAMGAFTETGTLTYERGLHTFTLRVQLRQEGDDARAVVLERALDVARGQLAGLGVEHRGLRATAVDMADTWRRRPHRPTD